MSSPPSNLPVMPLTIGIAPFPEGFQGDLDETFQQAVQLMTAYAQGQFLTGVILPPNSTLPTSNVGAVLMGGVWYYWNPSTNSYQPQTVSAKPAKNYCKNPVYQVAQTGSSITVGAGVVPLYDMCQARTSLANVLAVAADVGPAAGPNNDCIPSAIKYTVGPTLVPTPAATDLYAHEHLLEGSDIAPLQGQITSLSFWVFAGVAGTYSAYITNHNRDTSYVSQFTITAAQAGIWTEITIPSIPPFPTTGTWSYSEGATGLYVGVVMALGTQWQTANLNAWENAFFAGGASNINMLTVVNNTLKITGIKLEASPSCTYLQTPAFEDDLEQCIRYYWTDFNYQSTNIGTPMTFVASGTTAAYGSLIFPRRMCKAPTVVPYSTVTPYTAGNVYDINSAANVAVATLPATPKGTGGAITITGTKGDVLSAFITADARLS